MKSLIDFINTSLVNEAKNFVKADSEYKKAWNALLKLVDKDYNQFLKYLSDKTVIEKAVKACGNEDGIKALVGYFNSDEGLGAVQGLVYDNLVMDIEDGEVEPDDTDWVRSGVWLILSMGMNDTEGEIIMSFSDYCDDNDLDFGDDATDLCRALYDAVDAKYHIDESITESKREKFHAGVKKVNEERLMWVPDSQCVPEKAEYICMLWRPQYGAQSTGCSFYDKKEDALAYLIDNLGSQIGPGQDTNDADAPINQWIVDAVENIKPGETVYFKTNRAYLMRLKENKLKVVNRPNKFKVTSY